ncbi:MAG: hypothetical protein Kow00120_02760 [Anaerolineae bacterium]
MSRHSLALVVLLALLIPVALTQAQEAPTELIDLALANLSARLGSEVTLTDLKAWTWAEQFFADTSLGCPAPDGVYSQVQTRGFQILFTTYDDVEYDYRVSADGQIVVLCAEGRPAEALPPTPTPGPGDPVPCDPAADPTYLAPRVEVGKEARVTRDGLPSNLRSAPATTGELLVQIPSGARFSVVGGPQCGEEMVWWQATYGSFTGWVAEGQDADYYIEPLGPAPLGAANAGEMARLNAFQHDSPVTAVLFVTDGQIAAGYEDGTVRLWDAAGDAEQTPLAGEPHAAAVTALAAIQPDAAALGLTEAQPRLASGDAAGTVIFWDPVAQAQLATVAAHDDAVISMAFSVDGTLLATAGADGAVKLWNAATGAEIAVITQFSGAVTSLAFNAQGDLLTTGSADGGVWVWGLPAQ